MDDHMCSCVHSQRNILPIYVHSIYLYVYSLHSSSNINSLYFEHDLNLLYSSLIFQKCIYHDFFKHSSMKYNRVALKC